MRNLRFRCVGLMFLLLLFAPAGQAQGAYTYDVLYSFCAVDKPTCTDGALANPGLIMDSSGNLYGTTDHGGSGPYDGGGYGGTVFEWDTSTSKESVIYSFCTDMGCVDGALANGGLFQDGAGNFYGTTNGGGNFSWGAIFEIDAVGLGESVLYSFCLDNGFLCPDGATPPVGVIRDSDGNLYGVTESGGEQEKEFGTVFEVSTATGYGVLYSFCSSETMAGVCTDGSTPFASLTRDAGGNLYGTTLGGGANGADDGTVFRLSPPVSPATAWTETVLYSFCSLSSCEDGQGPAGGLIRDASGNLYGTTQYGGANGDYGTVFKLDTTNHLTTLYSFCAATGCTDGKYPVGNLLMDSSGNLYGVASQGGSGSYTLGDLTGGAVFELSPPVAPATTWTESVLYSFCSLASCADGQSPGGNLLMDSSGNIYGTTELGGANYQYAGVLFELKPTVATPATLTTPTPSTTLSGSSVTFDWTAGSGVTEYDLHLGTSKGAYNLYASGPVTKTTASVTGLPTYGATIYATLLSMIGGVWQSEYYTYTEAGTAVLATLTTPTPSTTLSGSSVTFDWSAGGGVTEYDLHLGTSKGAYNLYASGGVTKTSVSVTGLPTYGATIYATLLSMVNGVYQPEYYTYTEAGTPVLATLTTPTPSTTLSGSSVTFDWTAGGGVTGYDLHLGTSKGAYNLYASGGVTKTSVSVTGLPTYGATIYATLLSMVNGVYQPEYYTYTEAGTPVLATLTTPTPSTTLSGSSVTFDWTAGGGVTGYDLHLGTSKGAYNLYASGGVTKTSVSVTGLPTYGATIYATLLSMVNGVYQPEYYTYTEAGTPVLATLTTPTPSTTLSGSSVTFDWTTGGGVTEYDLHLGTSKGAYNLYASGPVTKTSVSVTGLPTNGETIYATLLSMVNGVWQSEYYTYTAAP